MTKHNRKDLEKALRESRRALPNEIKLAVVGPLVMWSLYRYAGLPLWIALVLGFFAVIGAVIDAYNIEYVKRQLRRIGVIGVGDDGKSDRA